MRFGVIYQLDLGLLAVQAVRGRVTAFAGRLATGNARSQLDRPKTFLKTNSRVAIIFG